MHREIYRWVWVVLCWGLLMGNPAHAGTYDQFFQAIERNDAVTVDKLLDLGFPINTPDPKGNPPLVLALQENASAVVATLIDAEDTDWDAPNASGETALMMAAIKGNLPVAQALIGRGCAVNRSGWTPLHYAASGGHAALIGFLLAQHAQVDAPSPNGTTPLMMAAMYGSLEAVKVLVQKGQADITIRNDKNLQAIDFAKQANRQDIADWLSHWRSSTQTEDALPPSLASSAILVMARSASRSLGTPISSAPMRSASPSVDTNLNTASNMASNPSLSTTHTTDTDTDVGSGKTSVATPVLAPLTPTMPAVQSAIPDGKDSKDEKNNKEDQRKDTADKANDADDLDAEDH
jgi:ankyrin repeat protein